MADALAHEIVTTNMGVLDNWVTLSSFRPKLAALLETVLRESR